MIAKPDDIRKAAAEIARRKSAAALTGAGISVESGIPDFRSPGGIWSRYDLMEVASMEGFLFDPAKVWRFLLELTDTLGAARPNPAHLALARLEHAGFLNGVATQNVDGLHHMAGSRSVMELHGSPRILRCITCSATEPTEAELPSIREMVAAGRAPTCSACGGYVKYDVVLFNEQLPQQAFRDAKNLVEASGVLLVVGTTATVWPVAALPGLARERGKLVVEVNIEPTELTGDVAQVSLFGKAGEVMPALAEEILAAREKYRFVY